MPRVSDNQGDLAGIAVEERVGVHAVWYPLQDETIKPMI